MTVPPMPPNPPQLSPAETNFRAMMAWQARAAVQISGAQQSHWVGDNSPTRGGGLGASHWDGTISYDYDNVVAPLRQMWQRHHDGLQNSPQDLQSYRYALQTMLHENSHMLSRAGETRMESAQVSGLPHNLALEEGVTEAWSRQHTDDYIRALGVDRVAPGVAGPVARDAYPAYTPATQALCEGLGRETGVPADEVMGRLNGETARGKWPAVADMVMDSSGLRNQIPPEQQPAARDRIQQAMQQQFAHLPNLNDPSKPMDAQAFQAMQIQSYEAGRGAVEQARQQVNQLRQEYPIQPPAPQIDRDTTVQLPRTDIQPTQNGPQNAPQNAPTTQLTAPNPQITPDMQRAMALTQSGVASMSGARPMGAVQAGERPQTGAHQPQAQRQGPQGPAKGE